MNVFELFATLSLDTTAYEEGLDKSEEKGSSFGKGLLKAGGVAAAGIAATTAAVGAGAKAFVDGVSSVAQYGDNIDKMSQKMNMSAEAYQEWDFIMQHSGTTIESMQASIKTLSNAAETGSEAFEQLGMSQEEIASMSGEELFSATITALQGMEDETQRTYLAGKLLGRGATELGALLNTSAEETEAMRQQVHELGGVMSDEAVKNAAGFQDSLQNMQTAFSGVKNSMLSNFLPSITTVMDGLSSVFSGDSSSGLGKIEQGVSKLASEITKQAPMFVSVAGTIISALVSGISQNLPALLSSGLSAVKEIGLGIVENLPMLLQTGMQVIGEIASALVENAPLLIQTALTLVLTLATGIGEAAPDLIPSVVEVIMMIVEKLTEPDTVMQLVNAAIVLIGGIAKGIIKAIPSIVKTIPVLVKNLLTTISRDFPQIVTSVMGLLGDLISTIAQTIAEALGMNWEQVQNGLEIVKNGISNGFETIKNFFSDLKTNLTNKVSEIWSSLTDKFGGGIESIKTKVSDGLDKVVSFFTDKFDKAKQIVTSAIDAIKGVFNFEWHLPELKLPHISVKGGEAPYGIGGKGSLPSFDIKWYRKAYDDAYILNRATIFGATGGTLLGGGEGSGSEAIIGTNLLKNMMRDVLRENGAGSSPNIIQVYIGEDKIDEFVINSQQRANFLSGGRA